MEKVIKIKGLKSEIRFKLLSSCKLKGRVYYSNNDNSVVCEYDNLAKLYLVCDHFGIMSEFQNVESVNNCANIGFSERDNKWYHFSPAIIFGFGVGSKMELNMFGFQPKDKNDFAEVVRKNIENVPHYEFISSEIKEDHLIVKFYNILFNETKTTPIEEKINYPTFGKGEWVAENLEQAKEMCIDFAKSVENNCNVKENKK